MITGFLVADKMGSRRCTNRVGGGLSVTVSQPTRESVHQHQAACWDGLYECTIVTCNSFDNFLLPHSVRLSHLNTGAPETRKTQLVTPGPSRLLCTASV